MKLLSISSIVLGLIAGNRAVAQQGVVVQRPAFRSPTPGGMAGYSSSALMPYSYYASTSTPARLYVGYGSNDQFRYYGQPYGHLYDRWSWSYLSGSAGAPARYYYPPLR